MKEKTGTSDNIDWNSFVTTIADLVPTTIIDKVTLFLKAFVPDGLTPDQVEKYEFS